MLENPSEQCCGPLLAGQPRRSARPRARSATADYWSSWLSALGAGWFAVKLWSNGEVDRRPAAGWGPGAGRERAAGAVTHAAMRSTAPSLAACWSRTGGRLGSSPSPAEVPRSPSSLVKPDRPGQPLRLQPRPLGLGLVHLRPTGSTTANALIPPPHEKPAITIEPAPSFIPTRRHTLPTVPSDRVCSAPVRRPAVSISRCRDGKQHSSSASSTPASAPIPSLRL